ncbi:hypothetical protein [Hoeflea sp. TYP-13]|uniref:hypothetical protein n=1 Tax=Hoeflea sp. TYP-13 TaxID=3230023 RepID=UPI0034C68B59
MSSMCRPCTDRNSGRRNIRAAVIVVGLAIAGIARAEAPSTSTTVSPPQAEAPSTSTTVSPPQKEVVAVAPAPQLWLPVHESIVLVGPHHPAPPPHSGVVVIHPAHHPVPPPPHGGRLY